jgi:SulP family sulfate permease
MSRYLPKSIVCLREGYTRRKIVHDVIAGVTVAIIALPLAMAFGIASIPKEVAEAAGMSPPAMGLFTAVVAGFLVSALGGSRVQIGGPTGAFVVIVFRIASEHGYAGLATATLMAGVITIIMGLAGLGGVIKFIPYPVTTGFTAGIAVIIVAGQLPDFFGLRLDTVPPDFVEKCRALFIHAHTWQSATLGVASGSLMVLIVLRRWAPRVPGAIVAIALAGAAAWLFHLPVETIGTRFGGVPSMLPAPALPPVSLALVVQLIPEATTIAILVAIESLLSAVVADGMIGGRHKTGGELIAQGVANVASVIFGGLPATGAIARTAANVKSGGRTPLAGMVHAVTLLGFMVLLAPLAARIPLGALSAVLMIVAWNMSEIGHFRALLRAPKSDIAVLLTTFGLTVLLDLTVAVGVGIVLASLLFMKRMADVSNVGAITREFNGDDDRSDRQDVEALERLDLPADIELYEINGPFFFGVADRLKDTLSGLEPPPAVFILRMRKVPAIDATGLHALEEFHHKCQRQGTRLVVSGANADLLNVFRKSGFERLIGGESIFPNIDTAVTWAREYRLQARGPNP